LKPHSRTLSILGSTGSIGVNTLEVVRAHPQRLVVSALAARQNWELLSAQTREFKPRITAIFDEKAEQPLREALRGVDVAVRSGMDGILEAAAEKHSNTLISAIVGSVGLRPVFEAIRARKTICLANKETLVVGGALVMEEVRSRNVELIPVDSEHSAIFQCLKGSDLEHVSRLILTASGGPFRKRKVSELASIKPAEALKHPNWDMGGKITIDSATLMNKGLEVIEAHWLFGVPFDKIEVIIHPQSLIHSMVEFVDGSIIGQMGVTDMKLPIQYALSHPQRWQSSGSKLDFLKLGTFSFEPPRFEDFPCLAYAYEAGKKGGNLPCIMNAANEIAVEAFLHEKIGFLQIPEVIRVCMDQIPFSSLPDLKTLLKCDLDSRIHAEKIIRDGFSK